MRLGLCCKFFEQDIRFRTTTATALLRMTREDALHKVARICADNAEALTAAVSYCATHGIGAFRVNSQILPVATHPEAGYTIGDLPDGRAIEAAFRHAGRQAAVANVRLSFHPDQFVVLNSPREDVVRKSVAELRYQAEVAGWIGADVINIHGGGGYGEKPAALERLRTQLRKLPAAVRTRLTLENDDRVYTPTDLLPVCRDTGIPLVYDVHHHRCLPDGLTVEQATAAALATWNREPLFHISSPRDGWAGPRPSRHHDYIQLEDVPAGWPSLAITVDVEAKAKELAVARLLRSR